MNKTATNLIVGLVIGLLIGAGGAFLLSPPSTGTTYSITTAGSTTIYPLSQQWSTYFHADISVISLNPSTGGSGLGQSQVADGLIDIGASSSYPGEEYRSANPDIQIIPISADALGIVANSAVNGSVFKMDCDMAVAIFQRNITTWEEFESTFGVTVSATGSINVYVRADASGTTATFAKWLEKAPENNNTKGADYEWHLGHDEALSWPASHNAVNGNDGVAAGIQGDSNGIGYVGLAFMEGLTAVELYNPRNEEYVSPSITNALKALPNQITDPGQDLMNSANDGAYPIARLLFYLINPTNVKWYTIVFLNWVLIQGQQYITDVGYVPIEGSSAIEYALSVASQISPSV